MTRNRTVNIHVRVSETEAAKLDALRRWHKNLPGRTEQIVQLIDAEYQRECASRGIDPKEVEGNGLAEG